MPLESYKIKYSCRLFTFLLLVAAVTIYVYHPRRYHISPLKVLNETLPSRNTRYSRTDLHLTLVCVQTKYTTMAIASIKSILFHRRKRYKVTFHIFTDKDGQTIIEQYFLNRTQKNCVHFEFYDIRPLLNSSQKFLDRHGLVVTHYSGIYAVAKSFTHEFLPSDLGHVIMLDTDIIFLDDVYSIWDEFHRFIPEKTIIGLAPWYPLPEKNYQYKGNGPDSHLTGVVLLDLTLAHRMNLTHLFSAMIQYASVRFGLRSLWTADQVILSLFASYMPEHFVPLPCYTNAHTYHYLNDGQRWQSSCPGEYPRNVHVVPAQRLRKNNDYFGHMFLVFDQMPIEWLQFCI